MQSASEKRDHSISQRLYGLLLWAYPVEFRREFGSHMAQVFRDCHRAETRQRRSLGLWRLWLHVALDVIQTAPREHIENYGKENSIMTKPRGDIVVLLGCVGIIAMAFLLLHYGIKHEVTAILIFGYILDALVTTGIIGNLIVFVLRKTTRLDPVRTALWTFLVVTAAPALGLAIMASRIDPNFRLGPTLVGYIVSFLFWFGLHWMWARSKNQAEVAS